MNDIIKKFLEERKLTTEEYRILAESYSEENAEILREKAVSLRKEVYGNSVFIRGLIEISNICKNDCLYCGIRMGNRDCERYRLSTDEILSCCDTGYSLGFRTFVLQGGEDPYFSADVLCPLIEEIKGRYPDCAVTLSLGEKSREEYKRLFSAGADRYLLRHETADECHYTRLHPENLTLKERMRCLYDLKDIGFQTGAGFMVGSPYQTSAHIAKDLKFIEDFRPDMCGIGPFIPHNKTPFAAFPPGSADYTCYLLSVIRIISPSILLPATTALGTLSENGREKGILSGANVIMPNLSPEEARSRYMLYNNKLSSGAESAEMLNLLRNRINDIGYSIVCDRGDIRKDDRYGKI